MDDLKLDLSDEELEKRLEVLVKADIINQGRPNFDYRGVQDNIFDKVFRGVGLPIRPRRIAGRMGLRAVKISSGW